MADDTTVKYTIQFGTSGEQDVAKKLDALAKGGGEAEANLKQVSGAAEQAGAAVENIKPDPLSNVSDAARETQKEVKKVGEEAERAGKKLDAMGGGGGGGGFGRRQAMAAIGFIGGHALQVGGAAIGAYASGLPEGESRDKWEKVGEYGKTIGGGALAGAGTGAMIGASVGSVVPGVGTAIGAGVGMAAGAVIGGVGAGATKYFDDIAKSNKSAEEMQRHVKEMKIHSERFAENITRVKDSGALSSSLESLRDQIVDLQKHVDRGVIPKDKMDITLKQLEDMEGMAAATEAALKAAQQAEATRNAARAGVETAMFERRLGRETQSSSVLSQMRGLEDARFQRKEEIKSGLYAGDPEASSKAREEVEKYDEQLKKLADTLSRTTEAEKAEEERKRQEAENKKSVAEAQRLLRSVSSAMGAGPKVDALSAKGWGSVGASITQGMERLQQDGNTILRSVLSTLQNMDRDSGMSRGAVFA